MTDYVLDCETAKFTHLGVDMPEAQPCAHHGVIGCPHCPPSPTNTARSAELEQDQE